MPPSDPSPSLKRAFPLPYIALNGLAATHALVRVILAVAGSGGHLAAWLIALGTHATVVGHGARNWPRRTSGFASLLVSTGAGTVALAALLPGSLAAFLPALVLAFLGSLAFSQWYAPYRRAANPTLAPGMRLPDLTLVRLNGEPMSTRELLGQTTAIFFFRGAWCPFCSAQVKAVAEGYAELERRGVRVAMVSPQPEEESRKLAERFGVDVLWLRDPDLAAARRLGIVDGGGVPLGVRGFGTDTVLPTLLVLDEELTVIAAHETDDYRHRADASTVVEALARHPQPATA